MKKTKLFVAVLAVLSTFALSAAAVSSSGSFTASCNPQLAYASNNILYNHVSKTSISITNTSTKNSTVRLVNDAGVAGSPKNIGGSKTATWTSQAIDMYIVQAKSSETVNCNGILPGQGTYKFSYNITY